MISLSGSEAPVQSQTGASVGNGSRLDRWPPWCLGIGGPSYAEKLRQSAVYDTNTCTGPLLQISLPTPDFISALASTIRTLRVGIR